jgi:hypothetical protein
MIVGDEPSKLNAATFDRLPFLLKRPKVRRLHAAIGAY